MKPKSGEDDLDISAYLDEALWTDEMDDMLQVDKSANTHFDAEIDDVSQVHKIKKFSSALRWMACLRWTEVLNK